MDLQVELDNFGTVRLTSPRSLTSIYDLSSSLNGRRDGGIVARVCAAFVGICWSEENEGGFPVYDVVSGDIIAYGTQCLEYLLKRDCSVLTLVRQTSPLFEKLYAELPEAKEVRAKEAFFPEEGDAGLSDSEDRKALG